MLFIKDTEHEEHVAHGARKVQYINNLDEIHHLANNNAILFEKKVKIGHSCEGHKLWLTHKPVSGTNHTQKVVCNTGQLNAV